MVQVLQYVAEHALTRASQEADTANIGDSLARLLALGFVRFSDVGFEITETGSRFLEECRELSKDTSFRAPSEVIGDRVTVVLPVLNEVGGLVEVLKEIEAEGYRNVLVVDGYSTDGTCHVALTNGVKVVYQHGSGKAGAVKTALEHVDTPYVLFMDGDYSYNPKEIWRLLNHNKHYCHVIGARDRKHIPRVHRFGNWVISHVFSALFTVSIADVCSGMYLLETREAKRYDLQETGFAVEIELAAQSASRESLTEVPISYRPRIGRRKLNTWKHGLGILSAAFALARRYNPIFLYSSMAGLSIIPAVMILGWVVLEQLAKGVFHSGWALAGALLLLVAVQAFTLASVSILTKHTERRLVQEIKSQK